MLATHSTSVAADLVASRADVSWKQIIGSVEPFLQAVSRGLADQVLTFNPDIASYAEYALAASGKQLRPVLVALSANATGKANDSHVLAAVIIEMIHLATLVHDDVMDGAALRRGRPALAAAWGNEIAVLLGDCLFAHALELAASYPTTDICRAVSAATNTVCSGEILQTQRRKNFELSRPEYFQVLQMKTGELFALSCELGAFLSGAEAPDRLALRQYGLAIGTAYQIYDDCLDLFGTEVGAGKSLGTDLAKGKITLPLLLLLEKADMRLRADVKSRVQNWDPAHLPHLLEVLLQHDILNGCRDAVGEYLHAACEALESLPETDGRRALAALARFLGRQTDALGG